MMLMQTGHVAHILFGFDTGWNPQRRDDGSIPFKAIVRRHRSHVALGIVRLVAGLLISPSLVAWMSPTIAGLMFAIFISWASGQLRSASRSARSACCRRRKRPRRRRSPSAPMTLARQLAAERRRRHRLHPLHPRRRGIPRGARGVPAGLPAARERRHQRGARAGRSQAQRRRDDRRRHRLAEAEGAHGRAARPSADRRDRPPATNRSDCDTGGRESSVGAESFSRFTGEGANASRHPPSQQQRVAHHADARQRHGGAGGDGRQHAGGGGRDHHDIVGEGEEQVLLDFSSGGAREIDQRENLRRDRRRAARRSRPPAPSRCPRPSLSRHRPPRAAARR